MGLSGMCAQLGPVRRHTAVVWILLAPARGGVSATSVTADTTGDEAREQILPRSLALRRSAVPVRLQRRFSALLQARFYNRRDFALYVTLIDRKSTRLNSSHANISYAVFCLQRKNHNYTNFL